MKLTVTSLLTLSFIAFGLSACSDNDDKKKSSPQVKIDVPGSEASASASKTSVARDSTVSGVAAADIPAVVTSSSCANTIDQLPFESEVEVTEMLRSEGTWVLQSKSLYMTTDLHMPGDDVLDQLDSELMGMLNEVLAEADQHSLIVDLSSLDWKSVDAGTQKVDYQLTCTTEKLAENYDRTTVDGATTNTESNEETSNLNLRMSFGYRLSTDDLAQDLTSKTDFNLDNGIDQTMVHEFVLPEGTGQTFLDLQDPETQEELSSNGVSIRFFKVSEDVFRIQLSIEEESEQDQSLSYNNSNGINGRTLGGSSNGVDIKIPATYKMVIDGTYKLMK